MFSERVLAFILALTLVMLLAGCTKGNSAPSSFSEIGKKYSQVADIVNVDGKLAFSAYEGDKQFIVYDGKELGIQFDLATKPTSIDNKLAFVVRQGGNKYFIIFDGDEIGKEYEQANYPISVGDKLAFSAVKFGSGVIVFNGNETETNYAYAEPIFDACGNVIANSGLQRNDFPDSLDSGIGKKEGISYSNVKCVGGKPAFRGTTKAGKEIIVYNGNKFGSEYNSVTGPFDLGGKLGFVATTAGKSFLVYDGKELGKEYSSISSPVLVGDKLAFVAYDGEKSFIIYDGKKVGDAYDHVGLPIDVNGKLAFMADKNKKWLIVIEN